MLCDICGKKIATVHLTEIINGEVRELHLCEDCALKKSQEVQQQFSLGDILAGLVEEITTPEAREILKCKKCQMTYQEFKKIGRLGCSNCYLAFKNQLSQLLRAIHGSNTHQGKVPPTKFKLKIDIEIEELKKRLKRAIELEEFEEAAKIRDKIKELEKKKNESQ